MHNGDVEIYECRLTKEGLQEAYRKLNEILIRRFGRNIDGVPVKLATPYQDHCVDLPDKAKQR